MAIDNYKAWLSQFLRRIGAGNHTITSSYPANCPVDEIAANQYYQNAGQYLLRVLLKFTKNEIDTIAPYFIGDFSNALTAGSVALPADYRNIFINSVCFNGSFKPAKKASPDEVNLLKQTGLRRSATVDNPYYYVEGKNITAIPSSFTSVKFKYVKIVPVISFLSVDDIWISDFTPVLVDVSVALQKGDSNNVGIEQFIWSKLTIWSRTIQQPTTKQNNTLIEQE